MTAGRYSVVRYARFAASALAFSLLAAACREQAQPAEPDPVGETDPFPVNKIIELRTSPDDPIAFVRSITFWRDNIAVVDGTQANVKVFTPAGDLVMTIGRAGDGPGEFRIPMSADVLPDGRLAVLDVYARLSIFGTDGSFHRSVQLQAINTFDLTILDGNRLLFTGGALENTPTGRRRIHMVDSLGAFEWSAHTPPRSRTRLEAGFQNTPLAVLGNEIASILSTSDSMRLWSMNGGALRALRIDGVNYIKPDWTDAPARLGPGVQIWSRRQMWANRIVAIDTMHALVQFMQEDDGTGTPRYTYTIMNKATGASVGQGSGSVDIAFVKNWKGYAVVLLEDGGAEMRVYELPQPSAIRVANNEN